MRAQLRFLLPLLALCLCSLPSPAAAERFAVIVGNNEGEPDEEVLRWAERDATRTHSILRDLGGVADERAVLLLGEDAGAVRRAVERLRLLLAAAPQGQDSLIFFYYSGHGDARALHLGESALRLDELRDMLGRVGAHTVLTIVDSCRDEPLRKGARHVPPFEVRLAHESGPTGRVTITSAAPNEVAQESDQLRSSFFTHHLLSGMRGAADRDGNRLVSLDELYRYAYHHTLVTSHARLAAVQHPQLEMVLQGEGDLVVTRLSRADALLELAAAAQGDYMIVDQARDQVLAQLYKSPGAVARVALPAGRFVLQVRRDGALYGTELDLSWGGTHALDESTLRRSETTSALRKGSAAGGLRMSVELTARLGTAVADRAAPLWGGGLALVGAWQRWRVGWEIVSAVASSEGELHERRYYETRTGMWLSRGWTLAPLELRLGAGAGPLWIREHAARKDELLLVAREQRRDALGVYVAPQAALELALPWQLGLLLRAELLLVLAHIDDALGVGVVPSFGVGLTRRL